MVAHCWCLNPLPSHEGRLSSIIHQNPTKEFKSTPFSRRETLGDINDNLNKNCLNPLPSHEGRRLHIWRMKARICLNPLPSHEGRPGLSDRSWTTWSLNPLPSHEGRRGTKYCWICRQTGLNPLPSHEGRPAEMPFSSESIGFKSTPFSRRETTLDQSVTNLFNV